MVGTVSKDSNSNSKKKLLTRKTVYHEDRGSNSNLLGRKVSDFPMVVDKFGNVHLKFVLSQNDETHEVTMVYNLEKDSPEAKIKQISERLKLNGNALMEIYENLRMMLLYMKRIRNEEIHYNTN